jgi:hypothetical protein
MPPNLDCCHRTLTIIRFVPSKFERHGAPGRQGWRWASSRVRTTTGVRRSSRTRMPGGALGARPLGRPSAELLGQSDDDALGAADIAEPIAVLVLRQLADEFGAMGAQAGNDGLDVVDREHDAT